MNYVVTADFSKFGYRELAIAGKLLEIYAESGSGFLGNGVTVNFNSMSGCVFLSDEDYNVGVLDDEETKIVQFYYCAECGYEGTQEDSLADGHDFESYQGFCSKDCALKNL